MKHRALLSALFLVVFIGITNGGGAQLAHGAERIANGWTFGDGLGFLSNTPDGTAFAINVHADRFVTSDLSLGPLLQLGFTGEMTQIGVSGQAKYWITVPNTEQRLKLTLQGGSD